MRSIRTRPAESYDFQDILYQKQDQVATVTINRVHAFNSWRELTLFELLEALQDAAWDDDMAVVVLTGSGDKSFCTGRDLKDFVEEFPTPPSYFWKHLGILEQVLNLLKGMPKPSLARVNGVAVGGGNELQLACDLAVAADHVYFMQVGPKVGSVPAAGATQWLPLMVGDRRARQAMWLCEKIPAGRALEWGLVNQVVPYDQLDEAVATLCRELVDKFPECLRYTKQQTNFLKDLVWNQTFGHARDWLALHYTSPEIVEGMGSFVEKRPANYRKMRERLAKPDRSAQWGLHEKGCPQCGASGMPERFDHCGRCGARI